MRSKNKGESQKIKACKINRISSTFMGSDMNTKGLFAVMISAMMIASVFVAFMGSVPMNVKGEPNGWSDAIKVSNTNADGYSFYPAIATDSSNNVHIVWDSYESGYYDIYYTKLDNMGNTIVDDKIITTTGGQSLTPAVAIAIDNNDNIHITWRDSRDGNFEIYYAKLDNNGNRLINDTRLTSNSANSWHPKIAVDNNNYIHIVWDDYRDSNWEVYYTKLDNNGNTVVDDLKLTNAGSGGMGELYPTIAIDSNNYIHITWEDNRNGNEEIYYTKLDNNGTTVIDDLRLTNNSDNSLHPKIAIDNNNYIHITWNDDRDGNWEVYYTKLDNNGNTIIDDLRLTNASGNSVLSSVTGFPIAIDSNNYIHITWRDDRDGNNEIYYTKLYNNGTTIIDDLRLTSDSRDSDGPAIAIDSNNYVHITWQDGPYNNADIYYKFYTPSLSVFTDKSQYYPSDYVQLSAQYYNGSTSITFQVKKPDNTTMLTYTVQSDENGIASYTFKLPSNAQLGTYKVYATTNDSSANTTFTVIQKPAMKITLKSFTISDITKGNNAIANIQIENSFNVSKTFTIAYQVINSNKEPFDTVIQQVSLNAGETKNYTMQVFIDNSQPTGIYNAQLQLLTAMPEYSGYVIDYKNSQFTVS